MAELQTKRTGASVSAFFNAIKDDQFRKDCKAVAALMTKVTKAKAEMWGPGIVGFGQSTLKYSNGKEIDWMLAAFAPRKGNITLYVLADYPQRDELLAKLGPHKASGVCLHIKRLSDVHVPTLTKLIAASVKHAARKA
jgi:hypothetical protein